MSSSIWQETLSDFVENVASAKPVPGGGAVAAFSACLAGALFKMLLEIAAKEGASVNDKLVIVETAIRQLQNGVADDIKAFESFMAARRLPKLTEAEKLIRSEATTKALALCTEVPLSGVRAALSLVPIAKEMVNLTPDKAISDFGAALSQLDGGLVGLVFTVDINLRGTASDPAFATLRAERDQLASQITSARQALAAAITQVAHRIGEP